MLKPDQPSDEEPKEENTPEHQGPSFDELMMLVFSGPMRFECLEEVEVEATIKSLSLQELLSQTGEYASPFKARFPQ